MPAEQLRNARSGAQIKFSTSGGFNESEVQQNMKIVKCFSRVSFSFHSQLAAAGRARKTLEKCRGKSKLRSSAMKELVWLLAIVIPSVWSDDGFLTEPRKCQVDCAALISKLQTVEDALQSVCQMI